MKILHYSLGFPPERSGGLIRYTMDLMNEQIRQGDEVYYLYPGHINLLKKTAYIKNDTKHAKAHFHPYSLVNSLPLPLFGGIKTPEDFMQSVDISIYHSLLKKIKPDVIHVHTLMGIHKEFFMCAKSLRIRMIFTSHDYFGLAPEPTFYYQGHNYDDNNTMNQWIKIGQNAMPTWKLRIFQLKFYPLLKIIKKRINFNRINNRCQITSSVNTDDRKKESFQRLKYYYLEIFKLIDFYHFNSKLAKSVFNSKIKFSDNFRCINITNSQIKKRNNNLSRIKIPIRVAYIGPYNDYKGFFEFIKLPSLLADNRFEFHVYGSNETVSLPKTIKNHGRFSSDEMDDIYNSIDIIVVPSLWKETFGFIVEEGLSYNKIVFASNNVGAKDLLPCDHVFNGMIDLANKIKHLQFDSCNKSHAIKTIAEHYNEIYEIYSIKGV
ncbi:glycosyltransferase [Lactiplantibacillus plantarum]|uniref:glycosyltransferase n=1 Tax=Lactiplantibacillus plantarum TaxID=1590 RepID=UPI003F53BA9C